MQRRKTLLNALVNAKIFENKEKASAVYKKAKEKYNNADIILCHTVQPDTPQHDNRA